MSIRVGLNERYNKCRGRYLNKDLLGSRDWKLQFKVLDDIKITVLMDSNRFDLCRKRHISRNSSRKGLILKVSTGDWQRIYNELEVRAPKLRKLTGRAKTSYKSLT